MASPEPRTRPPEVRRAQILDAAEAVLVERGARAATVDRIAEAAGVGKGTVYLHFDSKGGLLAALRRRHHEELLVAAGEELGRPGADDEGLGSFVRRAVALHRRRAELHRVLFHELPEARDESMDRLRLLLAGWIADGTRRGAFGDADAELAAAFVLHAVHGVVTDLVSAARDDVDDVVAALVELVRSGLRGPAASSG